MEMQMANGGQVSETGSRSLQGSTAAGWPEQ